MKWVVVLAAVGWVGSWQAEAVVLLGSSEGNRNASAPTGELTGSGWDLQGKWGYFLGTPIAPSYFITAKHVGGKVGDEFDFRGVRYRTLGAFEDSQSDLRIWRVSGIFPAFAVIHSAGNETGKKIVVFGRGGPKGAVVEVPDLLSTRRKGWFWTPSDGVIRWGENSVSSVVSTSGAGLVSLTGASGGLGELLKMEFNFSEGENEAHLSYGDSGGAVFLLHNGEWQLAGINYAVDGPYNTGPSGPGFSACIYDEGGLYKGGEGRWQLTPDLPTEQAGSFYATRISARAGWIEEVLKQVPQPDGPVLEWSASLPGGFTMDVGAQVDRTAKVIRTGIPAGPRFFRLRSEQQVKIRSMRVTDMLVFEYE